MNYITILTLISIAIATEVTTFSQNTCNQTFEIGNVKVDYITPEKEIKGTILVLPGWNFSKTDICEKSGFCSKFTTEGFALILPEMLKSIYSSNLFAETRTDWRRYPTLKWVTDTLIPWCQVNKKVLLTGGNNFVFGISTGGRGVAMVSIYTSGIFKAGAALSGDYNPTDFPADNLMRGYYGELTQFPDRWNGQDNPYNNASKLSIPLYLAHGKADNIVPYEQTVNFFNEVNKLHPTLRCKIHLSENAGHNYEFWSSEYNNVLEFFKLY